jgi:thioredoxin reductase
MLRAVIRTVDQVVTGNDAAAFAAIVDAAKRGGRVLVVLRSDDARAARRFRRDLRRAVNLEERQILIVTNSEVVCVDGIDGVEAVVIRDVRTGRVGRRQRVGVRVVHGVRRDQ